MSIDTERAAAEMHAIQTVWMPSMWVTDPRGSWEPIDGTSARLVSTVGWGDEKSPWAGLRTEGLVYDADLATDVRADGP